MARRKVQGQIGGGLLWLWLAVGAVMIIGASRVYFGEELAPFFIERLPMPQEDLWMTAVKVHVAAACWALAACLLLVLPWMVRRAPRLHRWLGRVTGLVLLLVAVPTGLYLACFARGGLLATLGFMLTGGIAAVAMVKAIALARAGDYRAHRKMTMHVLAQLSVAVTSRTILYAAAIFEHDSDALYVLALWIPVLASAGAVEWMFKRRTAKSASLRYVAAHNAA